MLDGISTLGWVAVASALLGVSLTAVIGYLLGVAREARRCADSIGTKLEQLETDQRTQEEVVDELSRMFIRTARRLEPLIGRPDQEPLETQEDQEDGPDEAPVDGTSDHQLP